MNGARHVSFAKSGRWGGRRGWTRRGTAVSWQRRELSDKSPRSLLHRIMDRASYKNQRWICFVSMDMIRGATRYRGYHEYRNTMRDIR